MFFVITGPGWHQGVIYEVKSAEGYSAEINSASAAAAAIIVTESNGELSFVSIFHQSDSVIFWTFSVLQAKELS